MPKYKGFNIVKKASYRIHESGYTLSNASTLAIAKRQAKGLANKRGTSITVEKVLSFEIRRPDGYIVSNADSLTAAKRQIDKW